MFDSLPKSKKLVPISEAAKVLGVSIDTVRRWDKSGVLHSERPDGKNRYFLIDELEKVKLSKPYSISDAAKHLGISQSTLRRLEARGLIKPDRNSNGERTYDQESLENFLSSEYFVRKKQVEPAESTHAESSINKEIHPEPNLKPLQRIPEFLATTVVFLLLVGLGVRNIMASATTNSNLSPPPSVLSETETKSFQPLPTPAVLAEIEEATPGATLKAKPELEAEATSAAIPETKPEATLTVKIDDGASSVNIRQKPTTNSEKIGQANDGDTFEFVSLHSGWYEIKLADGSTGFISEKYILMNGTNY